MIVRLIASPNPMPADLVVKNPAKMRSRSCGGTPAPVSWMDKRIKELRYTRVPIFNWRELRGVEAIASMEFFIRFSTTC